MLVIEARNVADRLRANLPEAVDVAALGVLSKAPYQLLCAREALIWRTEELARNACDALERDDFAVATILTRAVTESAALVWKLREILEERRQYTPQSLNDILMQILAGSKKWPEAPDPISIMNCIDAMDKSLARIDTTKTWKTGKVAPVRDSYDSLSEYAHPNWSGVSGLFSKIDHEAFVTYFGRGLRDSDGIGDMTANLLTVSLILFERAYNWISDTMPAFLAELEAIWPDKKV